jgi:hypothetical protein
MISKHCGNYLQRFHDDASETRWRCSICLREFTQRKRQADIRSTRERLVTYPGSVYCEVHTTIHAEDTDPYNYGDKIPECTPDNWRPLFIEQRNKGEEF